jgi:Cu+-exporting ATPase
MKTITRDPVCGMKVEESSPLRAEHAGATYLFCSQKCREKFVRDPDQFADRHEGKGEEPSKASGGAGSEKVR